MTKSSDARIAKRKPAEALAKQEKLTASQVQKAMIEAANALDQLQAENQALRRIILSERAQLMYYMEQIAEFNAGNRILGSLVAFMELDEPTKQSWVKKAIEELSQGEIEPAKLRDAYDKELKPV